MRILLLSCNTGEGHNATAKAIMEVLEADGISCEMADVLACLSPRFSKFICNWHTRLYKYAPRLFDAGYRAFEYTEPDPDDTPALYDLLRLGTGKLAEMFACEDYDAVICVHIFAGMMMTEVRKTQELHLPCFFVTTDYTCYPMTEQCDMDGYIVPHVDLMEEFSIAGLERSRLLPFGIPVRQTFYSQKPRQEVRSELELPRDGIVALLMCGSMGCGPIKKMARGLIDRLPEDSVVVAICGKNEKLYESMSEILDPRLRVLGFTRQISDYMDAADMIVTKPGGLSTTEAAAKHLPMVLFNTVGGCESRNFDFFLSRGYALGSDDAGQTVDLAANLALQPELRQQIREKLEAYFTRNSTRSLVAHVLRTVCESGQCRE